MQLTDKLQKLRHLDPHSADALMDACPPPWNAERAFRKTYRRFRLESAAETDSESAPAVIPLPEREQPLRRLWQIGGFAAAAAVYAVLFIGLIHFAKLPPPDSIPEQAVQTTETSETQETTEQALSTTAMQPSSEYSTEPLSTTLLPQTTAVPDAAEIPSETDAAPPVESVPAVIPPQPAVTDAAIDALPEPTQVTAAPTEQEPVPTEGEPEEPIPSETQRDADAPASPQILGHFETETGDGSGFAWLRYFRDVDTPVTEQAHSFTAEGFTIVSDEIRNADTEFESRRITFEDGAGQHYMVDIMRYVGPYGTNEVGSSQYNPDFYTQEQALEIAGKPAYLLATEDENNICTLHWDDGCHFCMMISQRKDLDSMIRLAESQINE